jgi:uncharacterized protein YcbX
MNGRHPLGEIAHLWCYPVKSLAAQAVRASRVGRDGFEGDRRSALFVATPGHAREGRTYRGKENNLLHTVARAPRAVDVAAERDVEIEVRADGPHFDAAPVSIIVDSWLAEVETMLDRRLDPLRYRPNVFVRAAPGFAASESDLVGRTLASGDVVFDVIATIKRCVTTTYDIETGASDPAILRVVAERRANVMGVYCSVRNEGTLSLGDRLWSLP